MMTLQQEPYGPIYSDFLIATRDNQLVGGTLIGPKEQTEAYRLRISFSSKGSVEYFILKGSNMRQIKLYAQGVDMDYTRAKSTPQGAVQYGFMAKDLVWGITEEEMMRSMWEHLFNLHIPTPQPSDPEFTDTIKRVIKVGTQCGYLQQCTTYTSTDIAVYAYYPGSNLLDFQQLACEEIAKNLKGNSSAVLIKEQMEENRRLSGVDLGESGDPGCATYLSTYTKAINEVIGKRVDVRYKFKSYNDDFFKQLRIQPYLQQKEIVGALATLLNETGRAIVSSEMGTGKTMMSIAAAEYLRQEMLHKKGFRTLTTHPSYLGETWEEEIPKFFPNAKVIRIANQKIDNTDKILTDNETDQEIKAWQVFQRELRIASIDPELSQEERQNIIEHSLDKVPIKPYPPTRPEFWIISDTSIRAGYTRKPGYGVKKIKVSNGRGERITCEIATCPHCGEKLTMPGPEKTTVTMTPIDFYKIESDKIQITKEINLEKIREKIFDLDEIDWGNHPEPGLMIQAEVAGNYLKTETLKYAHNKTNHKCLSCGEVLWQADRKTRKMSIIDLISTLPRDFFDLYIADELQNYKNDSAQGQAFGRIITGAKAKRVIGMTGTLCDGYAKSLYYPLWYMYPKQFLGMGYMMNDYSRDKFQSNFGFWEEKKAIGEDEDYATASRRKGGKSFVKALPGYTLDLFPKFLLENTIFFKMEDIASNLPSFKETVATVEMDPALEKNYRDTLNLLDTYKKEGGSAVLSNILQFGLAYPDYLDQWDALIENKKKGFIKQISIPGMNLEERFAKEIKLQEIIQAELEQGRKIIIGTNYTQKRDTQKRIEMLCKESGANPFILNSTSSQGRLKYIHKQFLQLDKDVMICHPKKISTGVTILEAPTIIFYNTGFDIDTLRQTARRSWRPGQTKDVRVIYMVYLHSWQEAALQLISKKTNAAAILEGSLNDEGLRSFGGKDPKQELIKMMRDNLTLKTSSTMFEEYKVEMAKQANEVKANIIQQKSNIQKADALDLFEFMNNPAPTNVINLSTRNRKESENKVVAQTKVTEITLFTVEELSMKSDVDIKNLSRKQKMQYKREKDQYLLPGFEVFI